MKAVLILSRQHGDDATRRAREDALLHRAVTAGLTVWEVGHLYHLAEDCSLWRDLAALGGPCAVALWLPARPTQALLQRHGAWRNGMLAVDLAQDDIWPSISAALSLPDTTEPPGPVIHRDDDDKAERERWYPLVDNSVCVDCGQCLQFCLFGVYEKDAAGHLTVAKPDRCKAGCPACSRICPQGAIMFPLYSKDPAIAGAPGTRMHLDAAGRALFFNRTGQACPVCNFAGKTDPGRDGPLCAGCGRHTRPAQERSADAVDMLLDDLDRLQKRRGR